MIEYNTLIHDRSYFERSHIEERKVKYNFTQAIKVETFLWNLELYGQLQRVTDHRVVLKGGTAAQLYFVQEKQRTSVDIDVIYLSDKDSIPEVLTSIHQAFGGDEQYFKFIKHFPENPKTTLPLETYFVPVPTVTGATPISIKVDFHFMDSFDLKTIALEKAKAFVFPLSFDPLCLSAGALIGDKLLTLAQGSVGIPPEREDDIPKQLYDLDSLTRIVDQHEFDSLKHAMEVLFDRELSIRTEKVSLENSLNDMLALLERYSRLDSPKGDGRARSAIRNFRGNYEPRPFRDPTTWGIISKRLNFLLKCIISDTKNPLSYLRNADRLEKTISLRDEKFKKYRAKFIQDLRDEFLALIKSVGNFATAKRLKNSRLERLFWEIVKPQNMEEIDEKITQVVRE